VLARAIEKADKARAEAGMPAIQTGVTNHTLRRTFASLLYEAGASPAYVMAQMGHASSALALKGVRAEDGAKPRHGGPHGRARPRR